MDEKVKAVEMVRKIRDKHADQLAGLNKEEQIAFYRQKSESALKKLNTKIESARQNKRVSISP